MGARGAGSVTGSSKPVKLVLWGLPGVHGVYGGLCTKFNDFPGALAGVSAIPHVGAHGCEEGGGEFGDYLFTAGEKYSIIDWP